MKLSQSMPPRPGPRNSQPRRGWDHVLTRRGDTSKAETVLGYRPKVALREGLERTHAWLKTVG